jgi:hypothetical protein
MICARSWLHDCMTKHNTCSHSDTTFHPTRLLHVGDIDSQTVRVELMSPGVDSGVRYATLSHCWGRSEVLRLTTSNMLRLQSGVPTAELAKTFQDAIFITRRLEISMLWIDSLCIVQDSKDDWERESSQMSHIYRHAVINIAAATAPDSDAGCLPTRSRKLMDFPHIQTEWNNRMNHNVLLCDTDVWGNRLRHMPLLQRAWVVQELLLAPRVLYICHQEMLWECYGLKTSERYPHGLPKQRPSEILPEDKWHAFGSKQVAAPAPFSTYDNITGAEKMNDLERARERSDAKIKNQMHELWRRILFTYTRCSLTYPSDRLVALSGVVKLMENALQDEYCAGLWRGRLISGLEWFRDNSRDNSDSITGMSLTEHVSYHAPSWSWASCDSSIVFGSEMEGDEPLIDIIHYNVVNATND